MITDNDFEGKKFIYPESDKLELKESFVDKAFDKYLQTICGFLNSGGGYLIFGIKDNLDLVGLNTINKSVDKIILRIDSIIGEKQLVGLEKDTDLFVLLDSSNIKTKQIITSTNKNFLLIEIVPKQNIKYQLVGGTIFYRLGASNYFEKTEKIYKQNDFDSACKQIQQKANQENKSNIELFQKTLEDKNKNIEKLNNKINDLEKNNSIHQTYIKNILSKSNINVVSTQPTNIINPNKIDYIETQTQTHNQNQTQITQYNNNILINQIIKKYFPCLQN